MKKVGIIVNTHARSVKKNRKDVKELFVGIGGDLVDVRATASFDELEQACLDFKNCSYEYIGITGGDGTIHHTLTRLINVYGTNKVPPLVILRGGTMDNIARDLSVKGKGPDILKRLVAVMRKGNQVRTVARDTLKIDHAFGFIFGTGIVTNILNAAYDCETPGVKRNLVVIFTALKDGLLNNPDSQLFRRIKAHVYVDDYEVPFSDMIGIIAATVEHKGMGFHLLPRANEKKGAFHMMCSGLTPGSIARQVLRAKNGIPLKGELNYNGIGSRLRIVSDHAIEYTIDGDLYKGGRELIIEMGPEVNLVEV